MIETLPIVGLFILACTFQDLDPTLGTPIGEPHPASLISRDGTGAMIAWQEIDGQDHISIRKSVDGTIFLSGLTIRSSSEATWAVLKPLQREQTFAAEWLAYDQVAKDGRKTAYLWSRGTCERIAAPPTAGP